RWNRDRARPRGPEEAEGTGGRLGQAPREGARQGHDRDDPRHASQLSPDDRGLLQEDRFRATTAVAAWSFRNPMGCGRPSPCGRSPFLQMSNFQDLMTNQGPITNEQMTKQIPIRCGLP